MPAGSDHWTTNGIMEHLEISTIEFWKFIAINPPCIGLITITACLSPSILSCREVYPTCINIDNKIRLIIKHYLVCRVIISFASIIKLVLVLQSIVTTHPIILNHTMLGYQKFATITRTLFYDFRIWNELCMSYIARLNYFYTFFPFKLVSGDDSNFLNCSGYGPECLEWHTEK